MNKIKSYIFNTDFLIIISISVLVFTIKCLEHFTFNTHAYDLSTFDTAISNTLKSKFLYSNSIDRSILSEHFCPILLIFLPLYFIFDSIYWLFLSQALAAGFIFFICYKIALFYNFNKLDARLIALICILNKRLAQGILYNFHPEIFAVPIILAIIYCYLHKKFNILFLLSLLLLCIKEDMALSLIGFLLFVNIKNFSKLRFLSIVLTILFFVMTIFYVIPYFGNFSQDQSWMLQSRWSQFGTNKEEIIINMLSSPLIIIKSLIKSYYKILETMLFLPLLSPIQLLMSLPYISLHSTSSFSIQADLKLYYSFGILPYMYWGLILSLTKIKVFLGKLSNQKITFIRNNFIKILLVILVITQWGWRIYIPNKDTYVQHSLLKTIPLEAKISAQGPLIPHLRKHTFLKVFPYQNDFNYVDADYILINKKLNSFPISPDELNELNQKIANSKEVENIYMDDNIYIYKKRH